MTTRKPTLAVLAAACLVCGLHGAVAQSDGSTDPKGAAPKRAELKGAEPAAPGDANPLGAAKRRGQVLASFAGGQVTVGEMEDAIAGKAPTERARLAADAQARVALLRAMVDYELLVAEAERRGYASHPVVLYRAHAASAAAMTRQDLLADPSSIPDTAVAARFAERARQLQLPRMRRASLLVVASEDEATSLRASLDGHPRAAFQKAVLAHSTHAASRAQAGQMGFFDERGRRAPGQPDFRVPEPVVAAAFATDMARVSQPFAYAGGFALVMVTGENRASNPTLAELEPELRGELAEEALAGRVEALAASVRKQVKPEVDAGLLDLIRLDSSLDNIPSGTPAAPADPTAPAIEVEPDGV